MKEKIKILVSDSLADEGMDILYSEERFDVVVPEKQLTEAELINAIPDYEALVIRSMTKVTRSIIEAGRNLKIIARAGVGIDNVDVPAATEKGILVINAPDGNSISTAEQTLALIFALARKLSWSHISLIDGKWDRKSFKGLELHGKTIGIIGLGRIGSEVCHRCKALGMKIMGHDPYVPQKHVDFLGIDLFELEDIYKKADLITVHTPLNAKTRGMIGAEQIDLMKKSILLINCARGGIFNEKDLYEALKNKKIHGAAFDTFEIEPPKDNPLIQLDNFLCTPHLGAATSEAQLAVAIETSEAVLDYFRTGVTRNAVNFPSISEDVFEQNKPFILLCEAMALLLGKLREGHIQELDISFSPQMKSKPIQIMKLAVLKRFLEPILSERINYINAAKIAEERKIEIKEVLLTKESDFPELISLKVITDRGTHEVSGTLFNHKNPRIVSFDSYSIELEPVGEYLYIVNKDIPGVVGQIGTALGEMNLNIATMHLGRKEAGTNALTFIRVDEKVDDAVLDKLSEIEAILEVKSVSFP